MTLAEAILYALLGLALQFVLMYWAIRLGLQHDRDFQARGVEAPAATRKVEVRKVRPMPPEVEGIMQEMWASRERAEARRIAAVKTRKCEPVVPMPV